MPRTAQYDREATLQRATHLFWERGYHACSLKQLESALDMRPGSIYAAFGSKEALFRSALLAYYDRLVSELKQVLEGSDAILTGLADYLRQLAREATEADTDQAPVAACMMVKTLLEVTPDTPELRDTINELFDRVEQDLTVLLESARDQGELPPETDCDRLARLWQAQIIALRTFAQRQDSSSAVKTLAEDMIQALSHSQGLS